MSRGDVALQKDTMGMFHFNPGIEQKTVPDYNPYTISKCLNCNIAKGKETLTRNVPSDNQVCAVCRLLRECQNEKAKELQERYKQYERLKISGMHSNIAQKKQDSKVAVIYSLRDLTNEEVLAGISRFNGLNGTSQWKKFEEIIVVYKSRKLKKYRQLLAVLEQGTAEAKPRSLTAPPQHKISNYFSI